MATPSLSVGDVLMQSQMAWKIGRAFSNKRQTAPADFAEIEREANALSEALKMLAEALHSNNNILHQADAETRAALNTVLDSARKTLSDLEGFVERYQVIRKKETSSGFVVERNWSEVVIAGYKTFKWTAAGGDLSELRSLLHLHTRAITMATEVLRSRSLARLDHMVVPMAESMSRVLRHPTCLEPRRCRPCLRLPIPLRFPPRLCPHPGTLAGTPNRAPPRRGLSSVRALGRPILGRIPCSTPALRLVPAVSVRSRRTSHDFGASDGVAREHPGQSHSPNSRGGRSWRFSGPSGATNLLPPPAMAGDSGETAPATPSSFFGGQRRGRPSLPANPGPSQPQVPSRPQTAKPASRRQSPVLQAQTPSYLDGSQFERQLFRNSAILCDVRGRLIEYSRTNLDEPDPRYNVEMVEACREARICVVRKRENREHVGTKVVTSIWILSSDGTHRIQHKLSEVNETVPYCSYFEPEKVSLQPVDGPHVNLKFHAEIWGAPLREEQRTSWVNYYFASANDAVAFQSAVFGRTLIGSYRTTKTTVIHPGLRGTFAFEEQFANIEMLRLWEDDGVSTPGAQGGLLALLHVSSNFGNGWARWWINSSLQEVRIKADSAKHAKVKGIDITVTASIGGAPAVVRQQRRDTVKRVTGLRIEFKTEEERDGFVDATKRAQERCLPLPEKI
ncbi:uncharacterized protein K489DRAFT_338550 [Dissoconium aciculare CBS 342.82]|uniref:Fungal N-terminal domain-containing protein n=1 Tax=Dissoconium aciculare CBS 342.82 TaxID=1314786 RepID=A0A6J3M4U8_9PEZI|nr:uncharacterized protein K489DRAFT_338550 [Dissoconium aciculare CBS 342.82]KAF1822918.1 hypothetical protein K489DRAFT_338550 [Dissoconium aciculare CBS 342.82]